MTYVQQPKGSNFNIAYETIKADQGYYLVSIYLEPAEELGYYLNRIPVIGWRIETGIWESGDSCSDAYPVTARPTEVDCQNLCEDECIGIEHPDGLIYATNCPNGYTLSEFVEHTKYEVSKRKVRAEQREATTNHD